MSNQQASYMAGRGFSTLGPGLGNVTLSEVVASQQRGMGFHQWWRQSGSSGEIMRGVGVTNDWRTHTDRPIREGVGWGGLKNSVPNRIRQAWKQRGGDESPESGPSAGEDTQAVGRPSNAGMGQEQPIYGPGQRGPWTAQSRTGPRSHRLTNVGYRTMDSTDIMPSGAASPGQQFAGYGYPGFPAGEIGTQSALGSGSWPSVGSGRWANAIEANARDA